MNIGEKIRSVREDNDISQMEMAQQIPMNQSNYSKIERNIQEPNLFQLRRICQILRLDPRYLLELEQFEFVSAKDMRLLKNVKAAIEEYSQSV